jgi:hypothetical protein
MNPMGWQSVQRMLFVFRLMRNLQLPWGQAGHKATSPNDTCRSGKTVLMPMRRLFSLEKLLLILGIVGLICFRALKILSLKSILSILTLIVLWLPIGPELISFMALLLLLMILLPTKLMDFWLLRIVGPLGILSDLSITLFASILCLKLLLLESVHYSCW